MEPCAAYGPFERQTKAICLECLEPPLSAILKSKRSEGHGEEEGEEGGEDEELCGSCNFPICHDTRCRQSHAQSGECTRLQAWDATRIFISPFSNFYALYRHFPPTVKRFVRRPTASYVSCESWHCEIRTQSSGNESVAYRPISPRERNAQNLSRRFKQIEKNIVS